METSAGMMDSITSTIERLSLPTRLVSRSSLHSSLHSHIMAIILTDTIRTAPMGTTITGDPLTDTAIDPRSSRRSADLLAPGTIVVQLMEFWDLKRGEQFALTNAITVNLDMAQSIEGSCPKPDLTKSQRSAPAAA
jgi:hypothetical protein